MINLEWFRTFRTVYKTQSLTRASELLAISQPAVSQHIAALEAQAGRKLFIRKSKGVFPSDYARSLNNMIAHALEDLGEVESLFQKKSFRHRPVINIGISEHLYTSIMSEKLCELDEKVHVSFSGGEQLIKDTEQGDLTYAIIPGEATNFDTDCHSLLKQRLVLVHSTDVDLSGFEHLFSTDRKAAERWLSEQNWYSHRSITPFIKQFWMNVFDKKRPEVVPYRVVPNENLVLAELARGSGLALCFDNNALPFLEAGLLKQSRVTSSVWRQVSLLVNRKKADKAVTNQLLSLFRTVT